ncbi:THAP domain-containing protein 2-like [Dysidea avara]|uniref:THAP domain-containing protein 2-like n=1 Tax=Dysidea avara TaxID=196820 RepID=UPI00332EC327
MPKSCCAVDCSLPYTKGCGVSFHRFPVDAHRRRRWIAAVNRKNWMPNEHTWLCGRHFISGTKSDDPLDIDFVPSIFNHVSTPMKWKMKSRASDYHRRKGTKKRRNEEASRQKLAKESRERERMQEPDKREKEAERKRLEEIQRERYEAEMEQRRTEQMRQTKELEEQHAAEMARQLEELKAANEVLKETNEELVSKCTGLEQQLSEVTKEKKKLEEKVAALSKQVLSEETMKDDAKKVKYFTGLPNFAVLKAIYNLAAKESPESADCPLFQQYLITLVKLRLNVGDLQV